MLLLLSVALAMEPGASRGAFQPDCGCMEIQPGAHADKHSTTWRPFADASHLEHLEVANKPLLSAVMADRSRVSLAEREALPTVASDAMAVQPLELRDQGTGRTCPHIEVPASEPEPLQLFLVSTEEARVDAAAVGRALATRSAALQACVGSGQTSRLELQVAASGKVSVGGVEGDVDDDGERCIKKALKGLRADVSQRAGGAMGFGLRTR